MKSKNSKKWYYGFTENLHKRLEFDNLGLNKSTATARPWAYIFIREYDNKSEALKFELLLKRLRNKTYITPHFSQYFRQVLRSHPDLKVSVYTPTSRDPGSALRFGT